MSSSRTCSVAWDEEDGFDPRGDSVLGRRPKCPRCGRRVVEWEIVEAIGLCERCVDREPRPGRGPAPGFEAAKRRRERRARVGATAIVGGDMRTALPGSPWTPKEES